MHTIANSHPKQPKLLFDRIKKEMIKFLQTFTHRTHIMPIVKKYKVLLLASIPLFLILFFNLYRFFISCAQTVDYSIYQEAMLKIASFKGLNPYIYVRDIHIFNDHFDPIIILMSPLIWLMGFHEASPLVVEWLWVFSSIPVSYVLIKKNNKKNYISKFLSIAILISFSKAILSGAVFSIHPTTWLLTPSILLFYCLKKDDLKTSFFIMIFMLLFRETLVFSFFGLGLYFLFFRKEKKYSLLLLFFSIASYFLIFKLRPYLLGDIIGYGNKIINNFENGFFNYFITSLKKLDTKSIIKFFYPFIILLFINLKNLSKKERTKDLLLIFSYLGPMIFLHLITDKFRYHYGTQMVGPIIGYLIASDKFDSFFKNKKFAAVIFIAIILNGFSVYQKNLKFFVFHKEPNCYTKLDKLSHLEEVKKAFKTIKKESSLLATGGIIPQLMNNTTRFHHIDGYSKKIDQYDYILIEKNKAGDTFPYRGDQKIKNLVKTCKEKSTKIITDNKFYSFYKGPFKYLCN